MKHQESFIEVYLNQCVSVITNDGKVIVGILRGYDFNTNIVLSECHERVFSNREGVRPVQLGIYLIRGDNVAVIGLVDETLDSEIDYSSLLASPLSAIQH
jgi:U6 snRNA-associated Sm-like protein LSm8